MRLGGVGNGLNARGPATFPGLAHAKRTPSTVWHTFVGVESDDTARPRRSLAG